MDKYKLEFVYDTRKHKTLIIVWLGQQIVDKRIVPEKLTRYSKNKIKKEILEEIMKMED